MDVMAFTQKGYSHKMKKWLFEHSSTLDFSPLTIGKVARSNDDKIHQGPDSQSAKRQQHEHPGSGLSNIKAVNA